METSNRLCEEVRTITVGAPSHLVATTVEHSKLYSQHTDEISTSRPKGWRRLVLFWSVSGGTVLSIVGFVALTLYQSYSDSLMELHRDLKHFNETSADYVKKSSLQNRMTWLKDNFKDIRDAEANTAKDLEGVRAANIRREERMKVLEEKLQAFDAERKTLGAEVQRLREELAKVEGRQEAAHSAVAPNH